MRNRRSRKNNAPTQNLDSFLDILTNTVGVLMFISLFITVVAVQSSTVVKTPLVSQSKKKPHFFEIRGNKIIYIDDKEIDRQIKDLTQALPECPVPNIPESTDAILYDYYITQIQQYESCRARIVNRFKIFRGKTDYYNVRFYDLNALIYEPIHPNIGESHKELGNTDSEFTKMLAKLNPQTDYLAFIVRTDSFAGFREARKQAWKAGYNVGWEPIKQDTPIIFGSNGRSVGIQ